MTDYCDYSFNDLYKAAYKKNLSKKEKTEFEKLSQEKINSLVLEWAKRAGWKTKNKTGYDGKNYLAFHP
jgi:hypothetical protein